MSATTAPRTAFVTLLTSDSYLAGALTCINSLLDVEGSTSAAFDTVCLVTPATVGQASIRALQKTFDAVVGVAEITTESWKELDLLGEHPSSLSLRFSLFSAPQRDGRMKRNAAPERRSALDEMGAEENRANHSVPPNNQVAKISPHPSPSYTSSASLNTPKSSSSTPTPSSSARFLPYSSYPIASRPPRTAAGQTPSTRASWWRNRAPRRSRSWCR